MPTLLRVLLTGLLSLVLLVLTTIAAAADAAKNETKSPSPFRFIEDPEQGTLTLFEAKRPVLVYNFRDRLKPGVPADRKRSCYVHPIYGLDGEVLTEDFSEHGHLHHRGLCWAWAEVKVDGQLTDPWDLRRILARFRRWTEQSTGPERAVLGAEDDWVLDGAKTVATEVVRLEVHKATDVGRAIDVKWRLEVKGGPIEAAGRKAVGYGGLLLRFPTLKSTALTTDQGPQPADANLKPCVWADLSARFAQDEKVSGAAIFLHPKHPGMPVGWTLRYYGLLNPAYPGTTPITLEPNKPLVLQYRLWIHRGDAQSGGVAKAYADYRAAGGK